jgi:hypothetical protein
MPLMPAILPSSKSIADALTPTRTPPTSDATGVKFCITWFLRYDFDPCCVVDSQRSGRLKGTDSCALVDVANRAIFRVAFGADGLIPQGGFPPSLANVRFGLAWL